MTRFQDMILVGEIVLQCKIAQRAIERLYDTHENFDNIETWCSIQTILVTTGNISKILWPSKKEYKIRGERLRQLLKIETDSPLSSRKFRNHFEHYDERVEENFENVSSAMYVDLAMNPHLNSGIFGNSPRYTHRGYNTFNNTVVFRNEILDFNELFKELKNIYNNCKPYALT